MALKPKTNTPAEGTPIEEGFRPSEISAWVAECRARLRRITGGEERHRAGLMAEARMRQALDEGAPLDRTLASLGVSLGSGSGGGGGGGSSADGSA